MTKDNIIKLLTLMGAKNIKARNNWVMSSCPFSPYTHSKGTDNKPSFGISVGSPSFFHCFSCQAKGIINLLPTILSFHSGGDYSKLTEFIINNESVSFEDYDKEVESVGRMPVIPGKALEKYREIPRPLGLLNLDEDTINYFGLKYDFSQSRIVIPIKDDLGRLVAIRGRYIGTSRNIMENYKFMPYEGGDFKVHGVWYNMSGNSASMKAITLTEGESDVWALKRSHLFSNIWGSVGAKITKEQLYTLQQVSNPILLFFDDDEAGWGASNKVVEKMKGLVPIYRITNYHGYKDARAIVDSGNLLKVLKSMVKIA